MNRISLALLLTMVHAACGGGQDGGDDPPPDPTISITAPTNATLVRATVTVSVGIDPGDADSVRLLVDGTVVEEKLLAPYDFAWDTTAVTDGTHTITALAVAGDQEFTASVDLDVDNTAPTVVDQAPSPGAENVWIGTSIELTTSEVLAPSSSVSIEDRDGNEIASDTTIDSDTITVTLTEQPALPNDLTVVVSATDLAGNPLDVGSAWTFNAPAALALAAPTDAETDTDAYLDDVTTNSQGAIVATWSLEQELQIGSFDGTAWVSGRVAAGYAGRVAVDNNDRPYVSYSTQGPMGNRVARVVHFDGTTFEQIGTDIGNGRDVMGHDIAVDSTGTPYITWIAISRIYVAKWVGKWQPVGAALTTLGTFIETPRIEIDSNDNPVVSYAQRAADATYVYVWRHEVDRWKSLGGKLDAVAGENTNARTPDLAIASNNQPIVTWAEAAASGNNIYVSRWGGSAWQSVPDTLRERSGATSTRYPSIAIDAQDRIALAWYEELADGSDSIPLWRFDGTNWASTFEAQRDTTPQTSVVPGTAYTVLINNTSYVMWSEERPGNATYAIGLQRQNRLP